METIKTWKATDQQVKTIKEMYLKGETIPEIIKAVNLSKGTINKYVKDLPQRKKRKNKNNPYEINLEPTANQIINAISQLIDDNKQMKIEITRLKEANRRLANITTKRLALTIDTKNMNLASEQRRAL